MRPALTCGRGDRKQLLSRGEDERHRSSFDTCPWCTMHEPIHRQPHTGVQQHANQMLAITLRDIAACSERASCPKLREIYGQRLARGVSAGSCSDTMRFSTAARFGDELGCGDQDVCAFQRAAPPRTSASHVFLRITRGHHDLAAQP